MADLEEGMMRDCNAGIIIYTEDYAIEQQSRILNEFTKRHGLEYFMEEK